MIFYLFAMWRAVKLTLRGIGAAAVLFFAVTALTPSSWVLGQYEAVVYPETLEAAWPRFIPPILGRLANVIGISNNGHWPMVYRDRVYRLPGGQPVSECSADAMFDVPTGYRLRPWPLACRDLPPGLYQLAVYRWWTPWALFPGSASAVFEVPE